MRKSLYLALSLSLVGACGGEDKDYGEPLDDPQATQSALSAIQSAKLLPTMTTNDTALSAVDRLSADFNLLAGAKLNSQNPPPPDARLARAVDEACVEVNGTTTTYRDCAYGSATANGTVTIEGDNVQMSMRFESSSADTNLQTDVDVDLVVNELAIDGSVGFDLDISGDGFSATATFDGDFAATLADGCAVSGELELHAVVRASGQRISTWSKAEYAGCDAVIVR